MKKWNLTKIKRKGKIESDDLKWISDTWYDNFFVKRSSELNIVKFNNHNITNIDLSELLDKIDLELWLRYWNDNKLTQQILELFNFWQTENLFGTQFDKKTKNDKVNLLNNIYEIMVLSYEKIKLFEIKVKQIIFPMTLTWENGLNNRAKNLPSFKDIGVNNEKKKEIPIKNENYKNLEIVKKTKEFYQIKKIYNDIFLELKNKDLIKFEEVLKMEKRSRVSQNKIDLIHSKLKIINEIIQENESSYVPFLKEIWEYDLSFISLRNFISHSSSSFFKIFFNEEKKSKNIIEMFKKLISKEQFIDIISEFKNENISILETNNDVEELFEKFIGDLILILYKK